MAVRSIIGSSVRAARSYCEIPVKRSLALLAACAGCIAQPALAFSEFPSKPVRLVVGYARGEPADLLARITAPALAQYFKQRVIIDNHPGASGNVAAALVAKARHDGYTLLLVSESFAASVSIYPNLPYDPQRDFAPVARIARFDNVLVVNSASNIAALDDLISLIRATPGHVTIASAGTGSTSHLATEMMKLRAGWLNALHVPYRASVHALADLLGAHVHAHVATVGSAAPHIRTGRLKGLAVTSAKRSPALPEVPTFEEAGFPGFEARAWNGVLAPAGTPYDAIVRVNLALFQVIDTPAQFAQFLRGEVDKWAKVVKASGVAVE